MKLKVLDIIIILLSVLVSVFFCINAFSKNGRTMQVFIKSQSSEYVYSLDRDVTIDVSGPLGMTRIVIAGGYASIADSPCPGKICVHAQPVRKQGEWIACLPNRVLLSIESRGSNEIDATSY